MFCSAERRPDPPPTQNTDTSPSGGCPLVVDIAQCCPQGWPLRLPHPLETQVDCRRAQPAGVPWQQETKFGLGRVVGGEQAGQLESLLVSD